MGCRIQISAFKRMGDLMGVTIGFEGDNCETSILFFSQERKESTLETFGPNQFSEYNDRFTAIVQANEENGAIHIVNEIFATYPNELLNELSERLKVGDYYYDDDELRRLINDLQEVKPYHRDGFKGHRIRHLQHHGVNKEVFIKPGKAAEQPKPQYETWGTW